VNPYWSSDDGRIVLYHGDMREVLPALGLTADLIVADPPYQETSLRWDRWPDGWPAVAAQCSRSMWCFGSLRMFLDRRDEFTSWRLSHDVIWRKQQGSGPAVADRFVRVHEQPAHWYQGPWSSVYHRPAKVSHTGADRSWAGTVPADRAAHRGSIGGKSGWADDGTRLPQSVIEARNLRQRGALHPTEKSEAILDPLIRYGCPPDGLVLDPFAGSCSTLDCARTLGMRAVGIEADEAMCEKAVRLRLSVATLFDGEAS